jgi:hypothetical protein
MLNTTKVERGTASMIFVMIWAALAMAVDIAAVIIGFTKNVGCGGVGEVSPKEFLLVGGFINIAATLMLIGMVCLVVARSRGEAGLVHVAPFGFLVMLTGLFTIAWSIVGLIMYARFSDACQDTPMGKMIISWSIIKLVTGIFHSISSRSSIDDVGVVKT